MFNLKRYIQDKCNHHYLMYGNKARTVYTPMICTKCHKLQYNQEAIDMYEKYKTKINS